MKTSLPLPGRALCVAALLASAPVAVAAAETDNTRAWPNSAEMGKPRDQQHASRLIGMPVRSAQNEKVGTVEDLMVDLASGRVIGVVLSSGGVMGAGDELSVVSPESLSRGANDKELRINLSREKLDASPRLKRDEMAGRDREGGVVGWRRDGEHDADNTGRNRRDRDADTRIDPLDQGNKRSDIETTARIRSAVVERDGLSTTAKNVKIVTRDGQITLRGPVATEEEKRVIADIAAQAAPDGRIDNQLEVASR
jgi:hyperosmotically inducible periplasmic protein